ncbi:DUF4426 domain-containing protein [Halopseudomonas pachastrellae]|nr:DUF4426 domain-containing protein [Halopseudomonas pachastrellae]
MFRRFCLLGLMLLSLNAIAGPEPTRFGDLVVYHNVFNSSMLQPDIAANAGLMRGPTHGVLNVAVQRPDGSAVDAVLKGEVRSLIGQPVALDFKTHSGRRRHLLCRQLQRHPTRRAAVQSGHSGRRRRHGAQPELPARVFPR